jgi:hypothetical protein
VGTNGILECKFLSKKRAPYRNRSFTSFGILALREYLNSVFWTGLMMTPVREGSTERHVIGLHVCWLQMFGLQASNLINIALLK